MTASQTTDLDSYERRAARLELELRALESVAVAFSGGVDSSVLLHAAHAALGESVAGVVADSPSLPRRELEEAREVADAIGARLVVVRTDELEDPAYRANAGDRCYFCKSALFRAMIPWAREQGFGVLAFGEITDDLLDDRPGARAAMESGVIAPLRAAGFSKQDVRRYAREHRLTVAEKPASACLASRIPVGTEVTRARLWVIERAEEALRELGFIELRVRHHGELARVEIGRQELSRAERLGERIARALAPHGFERVELGVYVPPRERLGARRD